MLAGLDGCYSFTTLGRARTIGRHKIQAFAAPEALIVPSGGGSVRPVGEIGARYGITDRLDAEARITTFGGNLAAHVQLRKGALYGVDVMVSPGIAFTSPDKLSFEVPIAFGLNLAHDNQLVLAPRFVHQLRFGVGLSRPIHYLFAGMSIGFAWRISKRLTFFPEFAFLRQTFAEPGFASSVNQTVGVQGAAGILLDL
jgi:hypothetical protein